MKKEYDFAKMQAVRNPYAAAMKNKKDLSERGLRAADRDRTGNH